jgi:uncharacterized lipoprotein YajG
MRSYVILLTLIALTGCASTQEVINTIPQAAGTYAGAAVFGGEVHMNPDPVEYIKEDVNREGRIIYNDARRSTQKSVSVLIELLLNTNK